MASRTPIRIWTVAAFLPVLMAGVFHVEHLASAEAETPAAPAPSHPRELEYPEVRFDPPRPDAQALGQTGIRVLTLVDQELPMVHLRGLFRAGSVYEPGNLLGLSQLTATTMRTGGTTSLTGDQIDATLERLGALITVESDREMVSFTASCHSDDFAVVLSIFTSILTSPVFDPEKMELDRSAMIEGIRRQNDNPDEIARREFPIAVYGPGSVWGRVPTIETVQAISREDCVGFHAQYFLPSNLTLGIAGDFSPEEVMAQLDSELAGWNGPPVTFPEIEPVIPPERPEIIVVPRPVEQSTIRMGHLGIDRLSPDRPAVNVLNYIYGIGGFGSRLTSRIRTDLGLAYSIWGYVGHGTDRGLFTVGCQTKLENTRTAIEEIAAITEDMRSHPVTDKELSEAVDAMTSQFVFRFETPQQIVDMCMDLEFYGYPDDYLDKYLEELRSVSIEDVTAAARAYLHPDRMVTLIIGEVQALSSIISPFDAVRILDVSDRAAKDAQPTGTQ